MKSPEERLEYASDVGGLRRRLEVESLLKIESLNSSILRMRSRSPSLKREPLRLKNESLENCRDVDASWLRAAVDFESSLKIGSSSSLLNRSISRFISEKDFLR